MEVFQKTLEIKLEQFKEEIEKGFYGDSDILHLIKYLCQNIYQCIEFESKVVFLIERLIQIYETVKQIS